MLLFVFTTWAYEKGSVSVNISEFNIYGIISFSEEASVSVRMPVPIFGTEQLLHSRLSGPILFAHAVYES